jgi:tRNA A-37 threonylcarbamoyl transferase component Bud32
MEEICKELERDIKKSRVLGKGNQGVIYDMGEVVVKATKAKVDERVLHRAADAGVGPNIVEVHKCNGITYIMMENMDDPFKDSKHGNQVRGLMVKMIRAGIFHNDIHAENMMAKNGRLYFVDFDNATLIDDMTGKEFDDALKYHMSYTDETYSKRIPLNFTRAQMTAILEMRPV